MLMVMKSLFASVFLFTSLLVFGPKKAEALPLCQQVLTQKRHQFEFLDPRLKMRQDEAFFLGEGVWGKVYLQADSSKGWKVEKKYKHQQQLHKDLKALQFLKSKFQTEQFRVVEAQWKDSQTMKLEYYPGRTIEDVFMDKKTSTAIKLKIQENYIQLLRKMIEFFEREEFLIDVRRGDLPRVSAQNDSFGGGGIHFIIKPDNIIIDPDTLEMTLIDPS